LSPIPSHLASNCSTPIPYASLKFQTSNHVYSQLHPPSPPCIPHEEAPYPPILVDSYHEADGSRSHKCRGRPHFNISETEASFLMVGEVPGVEDKNQVTVEWLQEQVLIISGIIKPADSETMTDPFQASLHSDLPPVPSTPFPLGGLPLNAPTNSS
jgi:hypothetical protein